MRRSAGTTKPHVFQAKLFSPQLAPLPDFSVNGTNVVLSSKLGVVETPLCLFPVQVLLTATAF